MNQRKSDKRAVEIFISWHSPVPKLSSFRRPHFHKRFLLLFAFQIPSLLLPLPLRLSLHPLLQRRSNPTLFFPLVFFVCLNLCFSRVYLPLLSFFLFLSFLSSFSTSFVASPFPPFSSIDHTFAFYKTPPRTPPLPPSLSLPSSFQDPFDNSSSSSSSSSSSFSSNSPLFKYVYAAALFSVRFFYR